MPHPRFDWEFLPQIRKDLLFKLTPWKHIEVGVNRFRAYLHASIFRICSFQKHRNLFRGPKASELLQDDLEKGRIFIDLPGAIPLFRPSMRFFLGNVGNVANMVWRIQLKLSGNSAGASHQFAGYIADTSACIMHFANQVSLRMGKAVVFHSLILANQVLR